MKMLLITIASLSFIAWINTSWAEPCLDTHVRLVTAAGRILDRGGITVSFRRKGTVKVLGSEITGVNGNACLKYNKELTGGEEVEIYLGLPMTDTKPSSKRQAWSSWRVLSPYKGIIYLPKHGKQRAPLEIVIAKKSLEIALMRYQPTEKIISKQLGRFECSYDQGQKYMQVIAVKDKVKSELLLSSFSPVYSGCREEIVRKGERLYRVFLEVKTDTLDPKMCADIRNNYLPGSKFKCEAEPL